MYTDTKLVNWTKWLLLTYKPCNSDSLKAAYLECGVYPKSIRDEFFSFKHRMHSPYFDVTSYADKATMGSAGKRKTHTETAVNVTSGWFIRSAFHDRHLSGTVSQKYYTVSGESNAIVCLTATAAIKPAFGIRTYKGKQSHRGEVEAGETRGPGPVDRNRASILFCRFGETGPVVRAESVGLEFSRVNWKGRNRSLRKRGKMGDLGTSEVCVRLGIRAA